MLAGFNPGQYAAAHGHYFARRTNRFWLAFSRSRLSGPVRATLNVASLGPEHDVLLPEFGIGFTDVVKRPAGNAVRLSPHESVEGAAQLHQRLTPTAPQTVCFHDLTGLRPFVRHALGLRTRDLALGPQPFTIAGARVFAILNPSPATAHVTADQQTVWYDALAAFLDSIESGGIR